jgi:hypothetical protein
MLNFSPGEKDASGCIRLGLQNDNVFIGLKWFYFYKKVEMRGIDPRTSRMLSERSTI